MGADFGERMELGNRALVHRPTNASADADVLTRLIGLLDQPDPDFAVVTP